MRKKQKLTLSYYVVSALSVYAIGYRVLMFIGAKVMYFSQNGGLKGKKFDKIKACGNPTVVQPSRLRDRSHSNARLRAIALSPSLLS